MKVQGVVSRSQPSEWIDKKTQEKRTGYNFSVEGFSMSFRKGLEKAYPEKNAYVEAIVTPQYPEGQRPYHLIDHIRVL
jgi:hypothetical protein